MRDRNILIRVNENEKRRFDSVSTAEGLPTASWCRATLLKAVTTCANDRPQVTEQERDLPLLSLFCGPGGLDEGFRWAGFSTRLAIDNDRECVRTFQRNHPSASVQQADINRINLEDLDEWAGSPLRPVGVIGGPPCQSFSVSNVHQREDDPRHLLPESYARILAELNSRHPISFFLFENVPGLLGKRHREKYEKFKTLFRHAGFDIEEQVLDAKNYGVPQERVRVFVVGINRQLHPEAKWIPPEVEQRIATVRSTIEGLPEPILNGPGLNPDEFPVHPNHWCLVPRSEKFKTGKLEEGQMYGRSFRTLYWDKPSWTVAYGHREVHVHPRGHRRLSIYEALRLQSFPDEYVLTGNMSAQIRLVSEAVPPRLAWHIAYSVRHALGI